MARRGYLRAVVAQVARNARLNWTLMTREENYRAMPVLVGNSIKAKH